MVSGTIWQSTYISLFEKLLIDYLYRVRPVFFEKFHQFPEIFDWL